jgi:site-specific recombinase XerD
MKSRQPRSTDADGFPDADSLAALRAWYAGLPARQAVEHYLGERRATGQSSRAVLGGIRRQLAEFARRRHRTDLAALLEHPSDQRLAKAKPVAHAIAVMRALPEPTPSLVDDVSLWVPARAAAALHAAGIKTLADVAARCLHRRRWWAKVPGLGAASAEQLRGVLEQQPALLQRAGELAVRRVVEAVPWERMAVPLELDGSEGVFRAPAATCTLSARTDFEAVKTWLELHETATTVRAYRKEAERLVLWAILERGKALTSLTTDDAVAYRAFLRRPTPRQRWVGPARPRSSNEWRPFQGELSARSVAYALSVVGAMFRWLVEQRYTLANPFAGIKVKGAKRGGEVDTSHALTGHEWSLVRPVADMLDLSHEWSTPSAQRLRFVLDFWFATGLRPSELVGATLGNVEREEGGDSWLHVVGKGDKPARVALPLMATAALERYLAQRGLAVSHLRWDPSVHLVPSLDEDAGGVTTSRMWAVMKRFFGLAATELLEVSPALAEKLGRATPHWMRHTHATYALAAGAELTTVRDNLRHASISTTSVYLNADDVKRARQLRDAFPASMSARPGR